MRYVIVATLALVLAGCGERQPTEVDRYTQTCHDRGGFVSAKPESWSVNFACVGQTTGAPLPPMNR